MTILASGHSDHHALVRRRIWQRVRTLHDDERITEVSPDTCSPPVTAMNRATATEKSTRTSNKTISLVLPPVLGSSGQRACALDEVPHECFIVCKLVSDRSPAIIHTDNIQRHNYDWPSHAITRVALRPKRKVVFQFSTTFWRLEISCSHFTYCSCSLPLAPPVDPGFSRCFCLGVSPGCRQASRRAR